MTVTAPRIGPSRRVRWIGRAINELAIRAPWVWRVIERPVSRYFDAAAGGWDERVGTASSTHMAPALAALDLVNESPNRALDVGTGTGVLAFAIAQRWPDAEVVGIDVSPAMIAAASKKPTAGAAVRFEVADIARLDDPAGFQLIAMLNMPPFFDQLARLTSPGGYVVHASSAGDRTPFYTSEKALRRGLWPRGFEILGAGQSGAGTYLVARKTP